MAAIKTEDLRSLSVEELVEKQEKLKSDLLQLRFDAKLGKLEKHSEIKQTKRDVARILTIINEKKRNEKV